MEKIINFLKKHSFYVVLTLCLITLGSVALITGGNRAEETIQEPIVENTEVEDQETGEYIEDADLVENDETEEANTEEKKLDVAKEEPQQVEKEEQAVATNTKPQADSISNPVKDGLVTRKFNIAPRVEKDGKAANVYKGVDVEVEKGTEVVAVSSGEVIEAQSGDSREGNYIKVKHDNGLVVMYGNLDAKLSVKKGDKISGGQAIGQTGNSIKVNPEDRTSENYLLLHVEKDKKPVDPLTIFKDLKVK